LPGYWQIPALQPVDSVVQLFPCPDMVQQSSLVTHV
jgi:hypothetical protein